MKTRKPRLLSALLALAMLLALLPTAAFAADTVYGTVRGVPSGNCGATNEDKVTWKLENGTLTISGKGEIKDTSENDLRWLWLYPDEIKKVIVENGVTRIGRYDFYNCTNLTEVDLSNVQTLKNIGDNAFANCSSLSTVKLPMNGELEWIDTNAFGFVDGSAPKIREIKIPASVKEIRGHVFNGCKQLENVEFAEDSKLETIYGNAFESTSLKKITIPASVTTIKFNAFGRCEQLQSVTFAPGSQLKTIEKATFYNCTALKEIEIPKSVKEIRRIAFGNCTKLESVTFEPDSKLETIGGGAFEGCSALKTISCDENVKQKLLAAGVVDENKIETYLPEPDPEPETYPITIDYGTAYDAEGNPIEKAAAGDVVTIEASETALEGMAFERWEVRKGEVKLENDRAAKTSFTMPDGMVQLEAMYQAADSNDSGWDAATVVTGAVIGTGTAILAYHIGMEVYAEQVLGKDVAVPRTRAEVALLAWQLAGSPAVNGEGEPLSEAAQAEKWAVESGLMEPDAEGNFNGAKKMSKLKALRTLEKAKQ